MPMNADPRGSGSMCIRADPRSFSWTFFDARM